MNLIFGQEKILRTMSIHTFTTIAAEILSLIPDSAKPQEEGNGSGSGNENECPICMDAKPDVVLGCGHRFCEKCMMEWFVIFLFKQMCSRFASLGGLVLFL